MNFKMVKPAKKYKQFFDLKRNMHYRHAFRMIVIS